MREMATLVILAIIIFAFWMFLGIQADQSPAVKSSLPPAEPPRAQPSSPPAMAPSQPASSFQPIVLAGSDNQTTPPFEVTIDEWVIDWEYQTDTPDFAVFSFFIYPRGETEMFVESVMFPGATSGSTYSYAGPGEYYIKVGAGNISQWEITIKAP